MGTAIRKLTGVLRIPHCARCGRWQRRLDRAVPQVWPLPGLGRYLKARRAKQAKREAQAKRNSRAQG